VLRVKVTAPPVRGRANAALLALLSKVLGVSKSRLSIVKGEASHNKVIAIKGLSRPKSAIDHWSQIQIGYEA
jgi:uncharacterized protein (TIGR00251 family)